MFVIRKRHYCNMVFILSLKKNIGSRPTKKSVCCRHSIYTSLHLASLAHVFWLKICPGMKYKNTGRDTLGIEFEKKKALKIPPINIKHYQYQWTNKAILSILHHETNSCDILTSPTSYSQLLNYMHYIFNLDLFFFFFFDCWKVVVF